MTEKNKKLKNLDFIMPIKLTTTTEGEKRKKKKEKSSKESIEQVKK